MPVFIVVQLKWTNVIALFSCIASELSRIFVLVHISIWETDKSTSFKNWTRLLWGCIFHFQTFPISRRCILWIREMIFLSPGNKLRWLSGMLFPQIWDSWKIQNAQRKNQDAAVILRCLFSQKACLQYPTFAADYYMDILIRASVANTLPNKV